MALFKKPKILETAKELEKEPILEAVKEETEAKAPEKRLPKEEKIKRAPPPVPARPPVSVPPKEPMLARIESVLEEGMAEVYVSLPDDIKPKFKAKGEETARAIRQMMEKAKVKARKIVKLIKEWLKLIPGVNKFFLEQEAVLKAQKLMAIKEEEKK